MQENGLLCCFGGSLCLSPNLDQSKISSSAMKCQTTNLLVHLYLLFSSCFVLMDLMNHSAAELYIGRWRAVFVASIFPWNSFARHGSEFDDARGGLRLWYSHPWTVTLHCWSLGETMQLVFSSSLTIEQICWEEKHWDDGDPEGIPIYNSQACTSIWEDLLTRSLNLSHNSTVSNQSTVL